MPTFEDNVMTFNEKIVERMQEMQLTKAQLAKAADIPYTTLDSMLTRTSDQKRMECMLRIAEILGTSVEELVFDDEARASSDALNSAEREIIKLWRTLDLRGKAAVQTLMNFESEQCEPLAVPEEVFAPVRRLKVYDFPAAAGAALPLFSEDYTWQNADGAPTEADFGIRISGDSMEPVISDGSIVWIKQQEAVLEGQIGIFLLNGEALCKKLDRSGRRCFLLSENPRYAPIGVLEDDDLRVVGRVLF